MGRKDRDRHRPPDKGGKDKHEKSDAAALSAADEDPVTVVERGSFAVATCACGWTGPGRRARKRAREDAAEHLAEAHPTLRIRS